ncbi:2-oxo acid dehydrogenase subunit E2 [Colwellia sp. MB02u-18]|uniref:dihydrolipoamide acetyltransferase family protein n=1 Tax=unclassified Colwellia TaxID=196834 RepID=UPI0015F3C6A2|nr:MULTISPECIES: dihydrolipoamide acetyltransferase family protein [unclassified Colwellia]MBA6223892.1 2-oxo acid dehydrogenase subunit E2 [Colwellia sp. MB3u-45]MBA6267401.1 2-oxo acid dehydrogenase subunit E2 [Colwellia sp. MB3u-43]MBA6320073.1 2-oxo acid dehydrogenase subunit E2 [Colwellia sp. MB02u-19]MBA6324857.1 2-oxo acid dehydrogenase subunit E2 [Colwellia sp. MB02u-18]MBA6330538.1 2-oxo acid dehydrogenase subunit E2 [Colwellia sp. MB02u-12]
MKKSIDITMPSLGADMSEGMLVEWLIKVGDKVKHGDIIAVLETQKCAIDMEAYHDGIITQLLVQPVNTVSVGSVLARIEIEEKSLNESKNQSISTEGIIKEPVTTEQTTPEKIIDEPVSLLAEALTEKPLIKSQKKSTEKLNINTKTNRVLASPIVRKIAKAQQLDLSRIKGSGPNGGIILKDITQIAPKTRLTEGESLTNMRSAIAAAMTKSKQEIPHFYLSVDLPINKAQQWLQQANKDKTPQTHILLIALVLKAVAISLQKYPQLNGFYQKDHFEPASEINIANVISLRAGGVVVPALRHVEQLSVPEIMATLRDITRRSRAIERGERLRSSELMGATITITNMGERGVDQVFGIIYPPQVAIIGVGKVKKVPQVYDEKIDIGEQITLCLSADHRVVDGMLAAKFLNSLAKNLQKPEQL